jgi:hypothetical protein
MIQVTRHGTLAYLKHIKINTAEALTTWSRVLQNLIITQLTTQEIPRFLWNQKAHYRVHSSPLLDPILSQFNPAYILIPSFFKIHVTILLSTPQSSKCLLLFTCTVINYNTRQLHSATLVTLRSWTKESKCLSFTLPYHQANIGKKKSTREYPNVSWLSR